MIDRLDAWIFEQRYLAAPTSLDALAITLQEGFRRLDRARPSAEQFAEGFKRFGEAVTPVPAAPKSDDQKKPEQT